QILGQMPPLLPVRSGLPPVDAFYLMFPALSSLLRWGSLFPAQSILGAMPDNLQQSASKVVLVLADDANAQKSRVTRQNAPVVAPPTLNAPAMLQQLLSQMPQPNLGQSWLPDGLVGQMPPLPLPSMPDLNLAQPLAGLGLPTLDGLLGAPPPAAAAVTPAPAPAATAKAATDDVAQAPPAVAQAAPPALPFAGFFDGSQNMLGSALAAMPQAPTPDAFMAGLRSFFPAAPAADASAQASDISEVRVKPTMPVAPASTVINYRDPEQTEAQMAQLKLKSALQMEQDKQRVPLLWFRMPSTSGTRSATSPEIETKLQVFERQVIAELKLLQQIEAVAREMRANAQEDGRPQQQQAAYKLRYPLSRTPVHKITRSDIERALRDDYVRRLLHKEAQRKVQSSAAFKRQTQPQETLSKEDIVNVMAYAYRLANERKASRAVEQPQQQPELQQRQWEAAEQAAKEKTQQQQQQQQQEMIMRQMMQQPQPDTSMMQSPQTVEQQQFMMMQQQRQWMDEQAKNKARQQQQQQETMARQMETMQRQAALEQQQRQQVEQQQQLAERQWADAKLRAMQQQRQWTEETMRLQQQAQQQRQLTEEAMRQQQQQQQQQFREPSAERQWANEKMKVLKQQEEQQQLQQRQWTEEAMRVQQQQQQQQQAAQEQQQLRQWEVEEAMKLKQQQEQQERQAQQQQQQQMIENDGMMVGEATPQTPGPDSKLRHKGNLYGVFRKPQINAVPSPRNAVDPLGLGGNHHKKSKSKGGPTIINYYQQAPLPPRPVAYHYAPQPSYGTSYGGGGYGSNAYGGYRAAVGDEAIDSMLREHQVLAVSVATPAIKPPNDDSSNNSNNNATNAPTLTTTDTHRIHKRLAQFDSLAPGVAVKGNNGCGCGRANCACGSSCRCGDAAQQTPANRVLRVRRRRSTTEPHTEAEPATSAGYGTLETIDEGSLNVLRKEYKLGLKEITLNPDEDPAEALMRYNAASIREALERASQEPLEISGDQLSAGVEAGAQEEYGTEAGVTSEAPQIAAETEREMETSEQAPQDAPSGSVSNETIANELAAARAEFKKLYQLIQSLQEQLNQAEQSLKDCRHAETTTTTSTTTTTTTEATPRSNAINKAALLSTATLPPYSEKSWERLLASKGYDTKYLSKSHAQQYSQGESLDLAKVEAANASGDYSYQELQPYDPDNKSKRASGNGTSTSTSSTSSTTTTTTERSNVAQLLNSLMDEDEQEEQQQQLLQQQQLSDDAVDSSTTPTPYALRGKFVRRRSTSSSSGSRADTQTDFRVRTTRQAKVSRREQTELSLLRARSTKLDQLIDVLHDLLRLQLQREKSVNYKSLSNSISHNASSAKRLRTRRLRRKPKLSTA
ncbi:hypothetical protein KR093_009526, partial [Drosophila rubida]